MRLPHLVACTAEVRAHVACNNSVFQVSSFFKRCFLKCHLKENYPFHYRQEKVLANDKRRKQVKRHPPQWKQNNNNHTSRNNMSTYHPSDHCQEMNSSHHHHDMNSIVHDRLRENVLYVVRGRLHYPHHAVENRYAKIVYVSGWRGGTSRVLIAVKGYPVKRVTPFWQTPTFKDGSVR